MNPKKYPLLFVDIETTHLSSGTGEIIEIAIIRENEIGETEQFYSKVKPVHIHTASPRALEINHYNEHEWKDAPTWKEIAPVVAKWLHYGVIVGHNVSFDWNYIDHHCRIARVDQRITFSKIDTHSLCWEHLRRSAAFLVLETPLTFLILYPFDVLRIGIVAPDFLFNTFQLFTLMNDSIFNDVELF